MASVWVELKRRNVVRVAVAYAVVGWLLIEVASTVLPTFEAPQWALQTITFLIILGFPLALVLAWVFDLTPGGLERTRAGTAETLPKGTGRKLDFVIIGLLALALVFMFVDNYLPESGPFAGAEIDPASLSPMVDEVRAVLPNSVAVLPLENLSPDPDNAYFAAGIHDTILTELAKLQNLNVIARTSVLRYADGQTPISQIAEELNVETVMEGSVQYADGRILVTAQLIDAETNVHLWSDNYDREFSDIFAIQADIAMNIANAVEAEFSAAEQESIEAVPTDSPAAYALYLSALTRGNDNAGAQRAIQDLDAAIALDPEFALAHAQRGWVYAGALLFSSDLNAPVAEYERNAIASAERAIELDPSIGLAYSTLATIDDVNWRWAQARRRTEMAYQLSPRDVDVLFQYVRFTRSAGDYAESIRVNELWARIDPSFAGLYQQLAVTHRYAGNYEAAATAARNAIQRNPAIGSFHVHLAYALAALGNDREAERELRLAEQLFGGNFEQVFRLAQMAMVYSLIGLREDAERMVMLLEERDRVGEAVLALGYLALEDYDRAHEYLEAAMSRPSSINNTTLIELKANPWNIRELETPRFRDLLSDLWSTG